MDSEIKNLTDRERQTERLGSDLGRMFLHFYLIEDPRRKVELFIEIMCLVVSSLVNDPRGIFTINQD